MDRRHNDPRSEPIPRDDFRAAFARREMSQPPMVLNQTQRQTVHSAIADACSFKSWTHLAINTRTNHVHIVVSAANVAPETVMGLLKAYATRGLRGAALIAPDREVWSRHGSTRYLWTEREVADACTYAVEGQEQRLE